MAYEPKDGDVSIFINKDKKELKQPDYTGKALIDGRQYKLAFWIKGTKPNTFLSGKIELMNPKIISEEIKGVIDQAVAENDLPF